MDSLSLVALIVALEEDFSIEFSDDDLCPEKIEKFEDLVVLVEKYIWGCGIIQNVKWVCFRTE